jgi:hypothetical protein
MALKIPGKVGGTPSCHTWGGQAVSGVGQQGQAKVRPGGSEVRQRSAQPGGQAFSKRGGPGLPAGGHEVRGTRGQGRAGPKWLRCSHEPVLKTRLGAGGGFQVGGRARGTGPGIGSVAAPGPPTEHMFPITALELHQGEAPLQPDSKSGSSRLSLRGQPSLRCHPSQASIPNLEPPSHQLHQMRFKSPFPKPRVPPLREGVGAGRSPPRLIW